MDKGLALLIVDAVVSLTTFGATHYLAPDLSETVIFVIGVIQVPVTYMIKSWKDQAVALIQQGIDPKTRRSFR